MEDAVNSLTAMGVFVVVSAGNSGSNGCSSVSWPAAIFENSFSVGATNSIDSIAGFSSRGPVTVDGSNRPKPNISAPGVNVRSSIIGTGYANFDGTSMAGPHVVGVVALMLDANPNLTIAQLRTHLQTPAVDRTSSIHCGGSNNGSMVPNNVYGHGRVDALASVNAVLLLLPVELIDFQGFALVKSVQARWGVAPNGSLNHFELERADERLDWATVNKQVFLPEKNNYNYLDSSPAIGTNYYRLKMVDVDGSIEYSKVISVRWSGAEVMDVSPNPVQDALQLSANWQPDPVAVRIFDASGRLVLAQNRLIATPLEPLTLDVAALPSGIYFLKIVTENGIGLLFQNKFTKY
jgi:subtilisin family serine protease